MNSFARRVIPYPLRRAFWRLRRNVPRVAQPLLHLAQSLVDLVESIGHEPERFAETRFERLLQLLVDGRAHLLEPRAVLAAQRIEALLDGRANRLEPVLARFAKAFEARGERTQLIALRARRGVDLLLHRAGEVREPLADIACDSTAPRC